MKKLIVAGVMSLAVLFNASAQNKLGYINTDELIGSMPEAAKAQTELKQYQDDLGQQYQDLVADFNAKDSIFSRDSAKLSPSLREIKRNELFALYQKVSGWQQQGQELYQQQAQKIGAPIREKAFQAIKSVAKENGYAYIFDINSIIVAPPGDDVIGLVKKKLGITAASPSTGAPKKN
jgi:outer membrane protein